MSDIKYKNEELGIEYKKLSKPQISTGFPFSVEPYQTDSEGNLTKYPLPLINATDINWGDVTINGTNITTTDDLLKLISTKGTSNISQEDIITNIIKGNIIGDGNAVTDINVSGNEISIVKDKEFLTEHQSLEGYATEGYVDNKIEDLVGAAPEALDTLKEIADQLGDNNDSIGSLITQVSNKANIEDVYTKVQSDTKFQTKGNYLTEHQLLKTINGESLIGNGDIQVAANIDLDNILNNVDSNSIIGIMLSTIRALQYEVAKLRNSFQFGINSYTEDAFGMSRAVDDLNSIPEAEPLWATDESELSFITGLDLQNKQEEVLEPVENYEIIDNNKIKYINQLIFNISNSKIDLLNKITDPKLYIYLTATTKNITFKFINENNEEYLINLNDIIHINYYPNKYNILCILSRKVLLDTENNIYGGNNFIWFSIAEYGSASDIFNGYIDIDNDDINYITSETPKYSSKVWKFDSIIFNQNESEQYIYKLDLYSKYQDVSSTIEAATPPDVESYKYCAAHLTIRSMSTYDKLVAHKKELQNNELIFCESNKKLYIYVNGNLINIGSSSSDTTDPTQDIMEKYDIIKALANQGLITINLKDTSYTSDAELYDPANIESYILNSIITINDIEDINFINGDTGKKFNVKMNPYGEFDIKEIVESESLEKLYGSAIAQLPNDYVSDRSFVSLIKTIKKGLTITKDLRLDADRVQIGSIYAPLNTDKIYGCTHGYIELFNSSDEDFYLDGCYLHYSCCDSVTADTKSTDVQYYRLPLNGYIPAGGTYLIRCKKYCDFGDVNTYINVDKYDIEWYVDNELLDLTMKTTGSYQFLLTYGTTHGLGDNIEEISQSTKVAIPAPDGYKNTYYSNKGLYLVIRGFIDSCRFGKDWGSTSHWVPAEVKGNKACQFTIGSNTIYKVTFAMDPAKQAFNSMTTSDSSRQRWQNAANDYQYVQLDRPYIEFPKTDIKKAVADYAPKASFEHKNVMTDKTQFNLNKPNSLVCSYGINPYTTRCFNWLSHGSFDEAVVIIDPNGVEHIFPSYTNRALTHVDAVKYTQAEADAYNEEHNLTTEDSDYKTTNSIKTAAYDYDKEYETISNSYPRRKVYPYNVNNIIYGSGNANDTAGKRLYNKFPGNDLTYTSHKCIVELCDEYEYDSTMEAKTYKYYVCRLNKFGKKDESYKSDIKEFTLYPKNYTPKLYQITDQQGFHWIEYQVWAAAAKKLNEKIQKDIKESHRYTEAEAIAYNAALEGAVSTNDDNPETTQKYTEAETIAYNAALEGAVSTNDDNPETTQKYTEAEAITYNAALEGAVSINDDNPETTQKYTEAEAIAYNAALEGAVSTNDYTNYTKGIMPIIINTGDAVQSGGRLNEWLDYFEAGKYLFDHFEQNNVVGNNDLCDTIITDLGTGDDSGKSNGYFFHLFNCYDIDNSNDSSHTKYLPIANGKYIPSLYYVDINIDASGKTTRLLFINSEITVTNCRDWFNLKSGNDVINIYTGFTLNNENQQYAATTFGFTPIYNILWKWTENNQIGYLPICHEMPFTVVTNACLSWTNVNNQFARYRSQSDAASAKLIGSHCNQISDNEEGKGLHWMSRLFESKGIKLCLGGHKHTYAVTYPARENYLYTGYINLNENEVNALNELHNSDSDWITLTAGGVYKNKLTEAEANALNELHNSDSDWTTLKANDIYETLKWSYIDGPMEMPETLENDSVQWKVFACNTDDSTINGKEINLSKFPIVKRTDFHKVLDNFNVTIDVTTKLEVNRDDDDNPVYKTYNVYKTTKSQESTSNLVKETNTGNYIIVPIKENTETHIYEYVTDEELTTIIESGKTNETVLDSITFIYKLIDDLTIELAKDSSNKLIVETKLVAGGSYKMMSPGKAYDIYKTEKSKESETNIYKNDAGKYNIIQQTIDGTSYYVYQLKNGLEYVLAKDNNGKLIKEDQKYYEALFNEQCKIQLTTQAPIRFYPFIDADNNDINTFVTYLMCQATGYKLTSNKELPSEFQKFSMVIPKSYIDDSGADKPSSDQQMPMYTIVEFTDINQFKTQLGRFNYISNSTSKMEFTQDKFSTKDVRLEYLILSTKSINGIWCHYDSKKSEYVQDDTYKNSKVPMNYTSGNYFTVEDNSTGNKQTILYPSLITPTCQYLFDTNQF